MSPETDLQKDPIQRDPLRNGGILAFSLIEAPQNRYVTPTPYIGWSRSETLDRGCTDMRLFRAYALFCLIVTMMFATACGGGTTDPETDTGSDITEDEGSDEGSDEGTDEGSDEGSDEGTDEGSDEGADVPPPTLCETYCALSTEFCTEQNSHAFSENGCIADCEGWPVGIEHATEGNSLYCRLYHLGVAENDPATHCPHANPAGGSEEAGFPCADPEPTLCETYCALADTNCTDDNNIEFSEAGCLSDCALWPEGTDGDTDGNSTHCRIYHLGVAENDPATHCPHGNPAGGNEEVGFPCVEPTLDGNGYDCSSLLGFTGHPVVYNGNTTDASADFISAGCPDISQTSNGAASPDMVFHFQATMTATHHFELVQHEEDGYGDLMMYITDLCPKAGSGAQCLAGADLSGIQGGEVIDFALTEGQIVYIVVDGWGTTTPISGMFELRIDVLETECDDGLDNDNDTYVDCDDSNCILMPHCGPTNDNCETAKALVGSLPIHEVGLTNHDSLTNAFSAQACDPLLQEEEARDAIFTYTAAEAGAIRFSLNPATTDFDAQLYVMSECPIGTEACLGSNDVEGLGGDVVELTLEADQMVWIVVDGKWTFAPEEGIYELVIEKYEDNCGDDTDNDGDNLTDCDDPDCYGVGEFCALPGSLCTAAIDLSAMGTPGSVTGDTELEGLSDDLAGCGYTSSAPEVYYKFVAPETALYIFSLTENGTNFDSLLYVASDCDFVSCLGKDDNVGDGGEEVEVTLEEGQMVYVVVDGWYANSGQYELVWEGREALCEDELDNDNDGLADCDDPDCGAAGNCAPEGDVCAAAVPIAVGETVVGHTGDFNAITTTSECGIGYGGSGPEAVYLHEATQAGNYKVTLVPDSGFDSVLYISTVCPMADDEEQCIGYDDGLSGVTEILTFTITEPTSLYIHADSYFSSADGGGYTLTLEYDAIEDLCDDGTDDDEDGQIDCDDSDCWWTEICGEPAGNTCSDPIPLTEADFEGDAFVSSSTVNFNSDVTAPSCVASEYGGNGPDMVFSYTAPAFGEYKFILSPAGWNSELYISTDTCGLTPEVCLAEEDEYNSPEILPVVLDADQTIFIYVDGSTDTSEGPFDLDLIYTALEQNCEDGLDDDGDGLFDCEDDDCSAVPICIESICDDGLDDEGDGLFDCEDPDCTGTAACIQPGDGCAGALPITLFDEFPISGSTTGFTSYTESSDCQGYGGSGPEVVYVFEPEFFAEYTVSLVPSASFDSVLYVSSGCPVIPDVCLGRDDNFAAGGAEEVKFVMGPPDVAYIFVDGYSATQSGGYDLTVGYEELETECLDGLDNDEDGFVDCEDLDCWAVELSCVPAGGSCDAPANLNDYPAGFAGTTAGFGNNLAASACGAYSDNSGEDVVFSYTAPAFGTYTFVLDPDDDFDSTLGVSPDCPSSVATCLGDQDLGTGSTEKVELELAEGQQVFILVDSYYSDSPGGFILTVETDFQEGICDDGLDDDGDELVDCADPDCDGQVGCIELFCDDGIDNDEDGSVDCDDNDCAGICAVPGDSCEQAIPLEGNAAVAPIEVIGSTTTFTDFYDVCNSSLSNNKDVVYEFWSLLPGTYKFELTGAGTDFDSLLYINTSCPPVNATCLGYDDAFTDGGEEISLELGDGERVYVFVDGWSSYDGNYTLKVSYTE